MMPRLRLDLEARRSLHPLQVALKLGHWEILEILAGDPRISIETGTDSIFGTTVLEMAVEKKEDGAILALLRGMRQDDLEATKGKMKPENLAYLEALSANA
jgi:hypothetical protein